jgi:predicted nucleic acid-binding Zn ribbon protein
MVMTGRKFTRVGELLPSLLNKLGLEQRFKEQQILELWPAVAGEELASRTKATRFARGVLYVYVDHGAWMQELHFVEKELINKLSARAPGVAIKRIRFSSRDTT